MADENLSAEVLQFLRGYIQSIEQLEILAVMRAYPDREWTAAAIYEQILSNERSIASRLQQFAQQGLVASSGATPASYTYRPKDRELDAAVERTLQTYKERRVVVIETIFRPSEDVAQTFANAFRFKKP